MVAQKSFSLNLGSLHEIWRVAIIDFFSGSLFIDEANIEIHTYVHTYLLHTCYIWEGVRVLLQAPVMRYFMPKWFHKGFTVVMAELTSTLHISLKRKWIDIQTQLDRNIINKKQIRYGMFFEGRTVKIHTLHYKNISNTFVGTYFDNNKLL